MLTLIAIILNLPIDNQIFKECPIFYHNFKQTEISISSAVKQGNMPSTISSPFTNNSIPEVHDTKYQVFYVPNKLFH